MKSRQDHHTLESVAPSAGDAIAPAPAGEQRGNAFEGELANEERNYRVEKTGKKLTRYDEFTGEPYEIDETRLVEDPNGMFTMVTYWHQSVFSVEVELPTCEMTEAEQIAACWEEARINGGIT